MIRWSLQWPSGHIPSSDKQRYHIIARTTSALQANRRSWVQDYLACGLVAETKSVGRLSIRYLVVSEPVSDGSQCPLNRYYKMVRTIRETGHRLRVQHCSLDCYWTQYIYYISLITTQKNRDKLLKVWSL
jgi:hypothetical protein